MKAAVYMEVVDNPYTMTDPTPDAPDPDDLNKCAWSPLARPGNDRLPLCPF